VLRSSIRDFAQDLAGGRVVHRHRPATGGLAPLSTDEQVLRDVVDDSGLGGCCGHDYSCQDGRVHRLVFHCPVPPIGPLASGARDSHARDIVDNRQEPEDLSTGDPHNEPGAPPCPSFHRCSSRQHRSSWTTAKVCTCTTPTALVI